MGKQAGCKIEPADGHIRVLKAAGRETPGDALGTLMGTNHGKKRGKTGAQCLGPQKFTDWCT